MQQRVWADALAVVFQPEVFLRPKASRVGSFAGSGGPQVTSVCIQLHCLETLARASLRRPLLQLNLRVRHSSRVQHSSEGISAFSTCAAPKRRRGGGAAWSPKCSCYTRIPRSGLQYGLQLHYLPHKLNLRQPEIQAGLHMGVKPPGWRQMGNSHLSLAVSSAVHTSFLP